MPIAQEERLVAVRIGRVLSRGCTGTSHHQMTGAIPAARLAEGGENRHMTWVADHTVAAYAREDSRRFGVSDG
jgi:hypothetical protein